MWNNLEKGFQAAFEKAWEAYKSDTIPIGVAIMSKDSEVMATGQNQIYTNGDGLINLHQIAHAEINAILKLSEITDQNVRGNIKTFTLYSTMEPCPLCFGAIVMGSIRHVKYAARDNYAGAAILNESTEYIKRKKITVAGPFEQPEIVQIALQTCFELSSRRDNGRYIDNLLRSWTEVCEEGVSAGKYLHENNVLKKDMFDKEFEDIYDLILTATEMVSAKAD